MKKWLVYWRGTITRDVGYEFIIAYTEDEVRAWYRENKAYRSIITIYNETEQTYKVLASVVKR